MALGRAIASKNHIKTRNQGPLVLKRWTKAPPAQDNPVISRAYTGIHGRDTYLENNFTAASNCLVAPGPSKRL